MAAAKAIANAIGCDERTIRRTIDDFERVTQVPDAVIKALEQAGFDLAALFAGLSATSAGSLGSASSPGA